MNRHLGQHLNEDQICRWLGGDQDMEAREHLAGCERCRREVGGWSEAFGGFQAMAREEGAARMAGYQVARQRAGSGNFGAWLWPAGIGLVAAATIALVVMLGGREWRREPVEVAAKLTVRPGMTGKPDDDAALLQRVDADLARTAPGPMEPLANLITEGQ